MDESSPYLRELCEKGLRFELGWGVEEDFDRALHWYRLAAAQGHAEAMEYMEPLEAEQEPPAACTEAYLRKQRFFRRLGRGFGYGMVCLFALLLLKLGCEVSIGMVPPALDWLLPIVPLAAVIGFCRRSKGG